MRLFIQAFQGGFSDQIVKVFLPEQVGKVGVFQRIAGEVRFAAGEEVVHVFEAVAGEGFGRPVGFRRKEWRVLDDQATDHVGCGGRHERRNEPAGGMAGNHNRVFHHIIDKPHNIVAVCPRGVFFRVLAGTAVPIAIHRKHMVAAR